MTAIRILIKFNLPPSSFLPHGWQVAGSIMKTDILPSGHRGDSYYSAADWKKKKKVALMDGWMLKGTMSSLPWPRDGNARNSGRVLDGRRQSKPWGRTGEAGRRLFQNIASKWGWGKSQMEGNVSLQEKQKVGRHYEQKRWMVYPLRRYINLFSTSYFPVCIQRKKLLTNRQKTILIINLYTDKQDRSQQRLWEIIPDKCLYTEAKPKVAQGQTNSRAIQMRKSALSACHFWCSYAAARTWTITPIPPPAPQN